MKLTDAQKRLKLCPFCGSPAAPDIYSGNPTIFCSECPALMGGEESTDSMDELVEAWNRRAMEDAGK